MSFLGVDIGGTKVAVRAENGYKQYDTVVRWAESGNRLSDDLSLLRDAVRAVTLKTGLPSGLGVAFPATVDSSGIVTSWPNRPHWVGLDWSGFLKALLPDVPTRSADDGDLAALAEADYAGLSDLVYFGVGTGVGGGIVIGGRSIPGLGKGSCEVGHMVIDASGPHCDCGRRGCLQAIASGRAVLRRAARLRGSCPSFTQLRQAWMARETWAETAIRAGCVALAAGVVGVAEMMRNEVTVIGGGFAADLPGFANVVAEYVERMGRAGHDLPEVRQSTFVGASSLHGALLLARHAWSAEEE